MSSRPGAVKRIWWRWKSLRLPWRKRWLVGFDLTGNTFWEFKDALNQNRLRRIVSYGRHVHYSDVNVAPQWVQWLRHTRADPPTINEQQLDEIRVAQMKELAARADARWASKPSALDKQADRHALPEAHPPAGSTPKDFQHQAQVMETVGEKAEELAKETPMERVEVAKEEERARQDIFSGKDQAATSASSELPRDEPVRKDQPATEEPVRQERPAKTKEFTGYKLARDGEQQPASWTPKARRR